MDDEQDKEPTIDMDAEIEDQRRLVDSSTLSLSPEEVMAVAAKAKNAVKGKDPADEEVIRYWDLRELPPHQQAERFLIAKDTALWLAEMRIPVPQTWYLYGQLIHILIAVDLAWQECNSGGDAKRFWQDIENIIHMDNWREALKSGQLLNPRDNRIMGLEYDEKVPTEATVLQRLEEGGI
jgi:hypothetical protein